MVENWSNRQGKRIATKIKETRKKPKTIVGLPRPTWPIVDSTNSGFRPDRTKDEICSSFWTNTRNNVFYRFEVAQFYRLEGSLGNVQSHAYERIGGFENTLGWKSRSEYTVETRPIRIPSVSRLGKRNLLCRGYVNASAEGRKKGRSCSLEECRVMMLHIREDDWNDVDPLHRPKVPSLLPLSLLSSSSPSRFALRASYFIYSILLSSFFAFSAHPFPFVFATLLFFLPSIDRSTFPFSRSFLASPFFLSVSSVFPLTVSFHFHFSFNFDFFHSVLFDSRLVSNICARARVCVYERAPYIIIQD